MKKYLCAILLLVLLISCFSCKTGEPVDKPYYEKVSSAEQSLENAKKENAVVIENHSCTSGKDTWLEFVRKVESKEKASVVCVHYYTLSELNIAKETYEKEKDKYPQLFFLTVEFDGTKFNITSRMSSEKNPEYTGSFNFMNHYTDTLNSREYEFYVLTDGENTTWDEIQKGIYSSQREDYVNHLTLYKDTLS